MCFLDKRTVRLQCILTNFKVATRSVIEVLAGRVDPCKTLVCRDWRIFFSNVRMDFGVARERIRLRAVGEVIDVFRADDVDQRQVLRSRFVAGVELDEILVVSLGAVPIVSISVDVVSVDVENFSVVSEDVAST